MSTVVPIQRDPIESSSLSTYDPLFDYTRSRFNELMGPDLFDLFDLGQTLPGVTDVTRAIPSWQSARRTRRRPFKIDVSEVSDGYFVRAELAGLRKEEIRVHCDDNNLLTIEGEMKVETTVPETKHLSERNLGKFSRSIRLPRDANPDQVMSGFNNGLLILKFGKKTGAFGKQINIS